MFRPEFEVGAVPEDGLRLWRAREAVRQSELRLAAQGASLAALEQRGQALVGWAVAGATALLSGLLIATLSVPIRCAAMSALVSLLLSATCALIVLWPSQWRTFGNPEVLVRSDRLSELEELETIALTAAASITANQARLKRAGRALTSGFLFFAFAPVAAAGAFRAKDYFIALGWV
jgi:hypothetical protein